MYNDVMDVREKTMNRHELHDYTAKQQLNICQIAAYRENALPASPNKLFCCFRHVSFAGESAAVIDSGILLYGQ